MRKRNGFTFIEISLFLAVTAALFLGVALGVQNSLFQQRYNDSTNNFLEFMRSIYSEVSNPQSVGQGNSDYAIYGKLVVFGERVDLLLRDVPEGEQPIYVYDVIGSARNLGTGDVATLLYNLNANVVLVNEATHKANIVNASTYNLNWGAVVENTTAADTPNKSILVVRHPNSGTINTLVYNGAINVNSTVRTVNEGAGAVSTAKELLRAHLNPNETDNGKKFVLERVNFCINPYGLGASGSTPRQNIRIDYNARNASGVKLVDLDGGDNACGN